MEELHYDQKEISKREKRQGRITSLTLCVFDEKEKDYQYINMHTRMYHLCFCYEKA